MYVGIFNSTFLKLLICYTKYIMQCNHPKAGIIFIGTTNMVYVLNVLEIICSMSLFRYLNSYVFNYLHIYPITCLNNR
jgi:hypothetical protein